MQRGKVIGALVLVAALGLVFVRQIGGPEDVPAPAGQAGIAAAQLPAAAAGAALPAPGQTRVYTVEPAETEIYWRIYRSGALARLGHNHVISMGELAGSVTLTGDLATASFELNFPVAGLVVDDPQLRSRFGEDFESVPSDSDKEGTKTNMLSDGLLNAVAFPDIRLEGTGVNGSLEAAQLPVTIHLLGREIPQVFPASIALDASSVTVSGEYRLTHEDLGLTPFTALGGAMAVGDEIDFSYRIHAVAGGR
jgi:polyisoprenoid-binding protein YceI